MQNIMIKMQLKKQTNSFFSLYSSRSTTFFKIFNDINFLKSIWSSIELAINFSVDLQQDNGTIPWSIDSNR